MTVGQLAKWLRSLGFDTTIFPGKDLHRLVQVSQKEKRIILTRNRRLQAKVFLGNIVIIEESQPILQAIAVLKALNLQVDRGKLFSRCLACNDRLEPIPHSEAEGKVPEFVFHAYRAFHRCPSCQRIYWEGTHPKNMKRTIDEILSSGKTPQR